MNAVSDLDYKVTRWFEERPWIWKTIGWVFAIVYIGALIVSFVLSS